MKREFLFHKGDTPHDLTQTIREFVNRYPNGVTVTVEPYCMSRSNEQNALFHVYLRRLATQSGFPEDKLKDWIKERAVGHGYPVERDENGDPIERNGTFVPLSTKYATVGQMKILIEVEHDFALQYDYVLEDVKG